MKKLNLTIIALIIATSGILAQSPQAFKYQAVARNASGNILQNQAVGMRISILQGSSSGTSVYKETHSKTTNDFGLINLEIGNGTPVSGTFSLISWGTNDYFVKIEMDANGGTSYQHLGTSQLLSVPYALFAENSANGSSQWSQNGSDIYFNGGNVGIGTTTPQEQLHIYGTSGSQRILLDAPGGAATLLLKSQSGYYKIFSDNDVDRLIFKNGTTGDISFRINGNGSVGIGTYSTAHKLSVDGTIRSKEVIVNTGWSDFVFEPTYKLPSLNEVELFINKNGHLSDIPSAKEVEENGVKLGNISSKLLQKIEELTLYTIDQENEINNQQNQIEMLIKQNQKMLQRIEKLENTNSKTSEQ